MRILQPGALELVQQQVRYVYAGFGGGNSLPASAEETWNRRYGDCKGKAALLLALLGELGIAAEAVLVNNSQPLDGLETRLPSPGLFDHVQVRAKIGREVLWLDATLPAVIDRRAEAFFPYRWVLPLSAKGTTIERLPQKPFALPQEMEITEFDASAGFDAPAKRTVTYVKRGIAGLVAHNSLSAVSAEQLETSLRSELTGSEAWDSVERVTYRFDETTRTSILTIAGTGPIEWEKENGYTYTRLPGGGFNPPSRRQRPAGESRDVPFYTEPSYTCYVTTMRLPADTRLEEWSVNSWIETILFGRIFYRRMQLASDHTLRLVRGSRVEAPEIPVSTAERDNGRLARFDNAMALLTWTKDAREDHSHAQQPVPATFAFDWASAAAPCLPENLRTAPSERLTGGMTSGLAALFSRTMARRHPLALHHLAAALLICLPAVASGQSHDLPEDATANEAAATAPAPRWAFEASDVPVDPGYTFGRLANGLRYIIRHNGTPAGTALVRMRIGSGALEEAESERGLSHFLEHMAFNGSNGIPEGEMVKLLEREGLAFGADTNAATGFEAITYMLNLPRNDPALLGTALKLMRETASELTISDEAVSRERGVVLAERRDRAGYAQRNFEDNIAFLAPGARYTQRLPIGSREVLESASAAQIRALYGRTYTPANTVLVVVGDYPVAAVEAAIRARFSDWPAGKIPPRPQAGPIDVGRKGLTDIQLDPALPESVTISRLALWRHEPDTAATRRSARLRGIGYAIVGRRLARLARSADAPFKSAGFSSGDMFEEARVTGLVVNTADGAWRKGMLAAVREVRQALAFGFTRAEVDEQLANIRTGLENAVKAADTRNNAVFAAAALALVSDERVPTTPEWQLAAFERLAPEITPEAVWQALLADAAPLQQPLIRFEGRSAPEGSEAALRKAFAEAMALPIAAPEEQGALAFGYSDFGPAGEVVSDTIEPRLNLRLIRFANGLRLTLRQVAVRKDRIAFALAVDGGNLMNTREAPLATHLAGSLAAGGLGKHSQDELASVLAGRSVSFELASGADAFTASAVTTPRDLALQMQVLAATLTDPGYRQEGVERFRKGIENFFSTRDATPARALGAASGAILSDGDPRFSLQPKAAYMALDYAGLKAVIDDRLANGAIELALVGDLDEEAAIAAVAATLGALPSREAAFNPREEHRTRSFTAQRGEHVLTHKGEPDQALLQQVWPTTDDRDLAEAQRLELLARIVRLELTDRLRETLGQAYAPSAASSLSHFYPGYGTFTIQAAVAADQIEATRAAIDDLVVTLRNAPVDADLVERARKPWLEEHRNYLKDIGGWLALAARAQSEPERIDRFLASAKVMAAITPGDLHRTALRYLVPGGAVTFVVTPDRPGPATAPSS